MSAPIFLGINWPSLRLPKSWPFSTITLPCRIWGYIGLLAPENFIFSHDGNRRPIQAPLSIDKVQVSEYDASTIRLA